MNCTYVTDGDGEVRAILVVRRCQDSDRLQSAADQREPVENELVDLLEVQQHFLGGCVRSESGRTSPNTNGLRLRGTLHDAVRNRR